MKISKRILFAFVSMFLLFIVTSCGNVTVVSSDEYKVTFYDDNNEVIEILKVDANKSVNEMHPDLMDSAEFHYFEYGKLIEWCTDKELTTKYDFDSPVTEDIKLYPKYSAESILLENLIFELNEDKAYYKITGAKIFEIYETEEDWLNGGKRVDFESVYNVFYIPKFYNGIPIKEIESLEIKQKVIIDLQGIKVLDTVDGEFELEEIGVNAAYSQLEKLGEDLFVGAEYAYVLLPNTLKDMSQAFNECFQVKVEFPKGSTLEKMNGAFQNCEAVLFEIPDSVEEMEGAFDNVRVEALISFPEDTKRDVIPDLAFYGARFQSITIPKSVKTIGVAAFAQCEIEEIKFENNSKLVNIREEAFSGAYIDMITIPASVNVPEYNLFEGAEINELYFDTSLSKWQNYITEFELQNFVANIYTKENGQYKKVE